MTTASLPSRPRAELPPEPLESHRAPKRPRSKALRWLFVVLGLLLLLGALGAVKASQIGMLIGMGKEMEKAGPPPEVVSTAIAQKQSWEATLSAVANVVSAKGVAVSNDAAGVVTRLHFESGATVKQGQVLVELDTKVEQAELASAKARRELAETSLRRSQQLVSSGTIAQSQLDADEASFKSLTAEVNALQAQIARKTIRAPFNGKLGMREINLGQYLGPGTTVTTLESIESDYIDFTLPQQHLDKLQVGMKVRVSEQVEGGKSFEGTVSAIDPSIDPRTRSIQVRATLPKGAEGLRPGMFLQVAVILPEQDDVVAIPMTAVVHASYGDSVFVVENKPATQAGEKARKVARQKFVRLGEARGDFVSVLNGLEAGEEVVVSGGFKLRNDLPLVIDNKSVNLDPKLAPKPPNR